MRLLHFVLYNPYLGGLEAIVHIGEDKTSLKTRRTVRTTAEMIQNVEASFGGYSPYEQGNIIHTIGVVNGPYCHSLPVLLMTHTKPHTRL